jgi:hypothetical protein
MTNLCVERAVPGSPAKTRTYCAFAYAGSGLPGESASIVVTELLFGHTGARGTIQGALPYIHTYDWNAKDDYRESSQESVILQVEGTFEVIAWPSP